MLYDALMFLMAVCFAAALEEVTALFAPDLAGGLVAALCVVAAMDGLRLCQAKAGKPTMSGASIGRHVIDIIAVVMVVRAFSALVDPRSVGVMRGVADLLPGFLVPRFFVWMLIATAAHSFGYVAGGALRALTDALQLLHGSAADDSAARQSADLAGKREGVASVLAAFGFGMVLVMGGAATYHRLVNGQPSVARFGWLLLYLVICVVTLAGTQLESAQASWVQERMQVQPKLAARWMGTVVLVTVGAGLLASIISLAGTESALRQIAGGLGAVLGALVYVEAVLINFALIAIGLLMQLFCLISPCTASNQSRGDAPQQAPTSESGSSLWSFLAYPLIAVVVSALIFVIWKAARDRNVRSGMRLSIAHLLFIALEQVRAFWLWLRSKAWSELKAVLQTAVAHYRARRMVEPPAVAWSRPGSARERVLMYYRAALARNAKKGLARAPSQTPAEYASLVASVVPEYAGAMAEVTDLASAARYGRADPDESQTNLARRLVARLRALRPPPS